jgi:hypothetical protein
MFITNDFRAARHCRSGPKFWDCNHFCNHSQRDLRQPEANTQRNCDILLTMPSTRCRVSYTDSEGIVHSVDVEAESLYEAVAIAVAQFRDDHLNPAAPGPMTEFTVAVYRHPTEHEIRLNQVTKWAERTTKEGPAGITTRQRVRALLAES